MTRKLTERERFERWAARSYGYDRRVMRSWRALDYDTFEFLRILYIGWQASRRCKR